LLLWKYFKVELTLFLDLARSGGRRGEEAFLIEIRTGLVIFLLFLFVLDTTLGVNLEEIFVLRVVDLFSVIRESYLALPLLTCLLEIYFAMKFKESLMFFEFKAKCSIDL